MSVPSAADLRAAALSDLRTHACGTTWSMLDILLPDVPGEPFGGTATPEQRRATAEATTPPTQARPAHLRALLRAWAESQPQPQPQPGSLREQIADGEPDLLARLQASLTRAKDR